MIGIGCLSGRRQLRTRTIPSTVVNFRKERLLSDQGSMTAPLDGIFGWHFRNHSPDPVVIRLEIEGFYTLVPRGEPGNEFAIKPVAAAPEGTPEQ